MLTDQTVKSNPVSKQEKQIISYLVQWPLKQPQEVIEFVKIKSQDLVVIHIHSDLVGISFGFLYVFLLFAWRRRTNLQGHLLKNAARCTPWTKKNYSCHTLSLNSYELREISTYYDLRLSNTFVLDFSLVLVGISLKCLSKESYQVAKWFWKSKSASIKETEGSWTEGI